MKKDFRVYDNYTSTMWTDDDGEWVVVRTADPWKYCFLIFPRRSCFSKNWIWGKQFKRNIKDMIRGTTGFGFTSREYATIEEVFGDRLKGAL